MLKVVRQSKQDSQRQTRRRTHYHNVRQDRQRKPLAVKRSNDVCVDVQGAQCDSILTTLSNVIILHVDSDLKCTALLEVQDLGVKDRRQPVARQNEHVIERLETVNKRSFGMTWSIIVEQNHGLCPVRIGVLLMVIRVGVMLNRYKVRSKEQENRRRLMLPTTTYRPMLFHPQPLASADEICSKPEKIVDPCLPGSSSMVGIVLHIQPDECLRNPINDRQRKTCISSDPQVLHIEEETDVAHCSEQVTGGSKLTSTANNLEYLLFDFTLERSVKCVSAINVS